MRLIIKDFLLQLKEKDELDLLICKLLLQMGYVTQNNPKTGNRQYGVDIRARKGKETILCVIKQGDLTRKIWDSDSNAVRQSLDEIFDCYLNMVYSDTSCNKIKIAVITNGMMDESLGPNWNGYIKNHSQWNGHSIYFEFWSIDEITEKVQEYLLNEFVFNKNMQSLLRRAMYYTEEVDYRKEYYKRLVDTFIGQLDINISKKEYKKVTSALLLASQMIAHSAAERGIYRIGIMVTEYCIIRFWKYILENQLFEKTRYIELLYDFLRQYEKWNDLYHQNIKCCFEEKNILYVMEPLEQRIKIYEVLGYLTSYAYYLNERSSISNSYKSKQTHIMNTIVLIFNNCPQVYYPAYDNDISTLSMVYRLLLKYGDKDNIHYLIKSQCETLSDLYIYEKKYPSPVDSFEDAANIELRLPAEKYEVSGFWGTMLSWIALLDYEDVYNRICKFVSSDLSTVTKCIWIQNSNEESLFYDKYAMQNSGAGYAVHDFKDYKKFRESLLIVLKKNTENKYSYEEYSFNSLEFIVSRYYGYIVRVMN